MHLLFWTFVSTVGLSERGLNLGYFIYSLMAKCPTSPSPTPVLILPPPPPPYLTHPHPPPLSAGIYATDSDISCTCQMSVFLHYWYVIDCHESFWHLSSHYWFFALFRCQNFWTLLMFLRFCKITHVACLLLIILFIISLIFKLSFALHPLFI